MEDFKIDLMIDSGPSARSVQIKLNPFTLIGATTRSGLLSAPLRSRFSINFRLEYYSKEILEKIVNRSAEILSISRELFERKIPRNYKKFSNCSYKKT